MDEREEQVYVTLELEEPIAIGFGITLPPGVYRGKRGRYWMGQQYFIELTAEEIRSLSGDPTPGRTVALYDVSQFMRLGKLRVF